MIERRTWSGRLLEGVTIILSILSAFALDSWWDARASARALDAGLNAVAEELSSAEEQLAERVRVYDQVDMYLTAVLDLLGSEGNDSVIEVPDTLMAAVLYAPTIDPPTGALAAFLESGLLSSVEEHELRQRLAALPNRYDDGGDEELDAAQYVLTVIRPMLQRSLSSEDFTAVLSQMEHYWALLRPSEPWHTPYSSVRLPATAEMHNAVASRRQMLRFARGEVANLASSVMATAALLDDIGG